MTFFVIGCGSVQRPVDVEEVVISPRDAVKGFLEQVAENGATGSELGELMNAIEELKATDSELANELESDGMAMMSASSNETKAKAKAMLAKLSSE